LGYRQVKWGLEVRVVVRTHIAKDDAGVLDGLKLGEVEEPEELLDEQRHDRCSEAVAETSDGAEGQEAWCGVGD
jgi:hypothetical protein